MSKDAQLKGWNIFSGSVSAHPYYPSRFTRLSPPKQESLQGLYLSELTNLNPVLRVLRPHVLRLPMDHPDAAARRYPRQVRLEGQWLH